MTEKRGRPKKENKKVPLCIKIDPFLLKQLNNVAKNKTRFIEEAIRSQLIKEFDINKVVKEYFKNY